MPAQASIENLFFNFSDRNYWFIRTDGGSYYDDFVKYGFVAIDNDGLQYSQVSNARKNATKDNPAQKIIADLIKKNQTNATYSTVHAKAILDFCFNIKKNDIVFIPDDFGALSFGIIQDQTVDLDYKKGDKVPFVFRRKVKWSERRRKRELPADVWPLFNTQKTVNNASKYSGFINPSLNALFTTGTFSHLSLDVLTTNPINARTLFTLGNDILDLSEELAKEFKVETDPKVDVKIELRSPGTLELIAAGMFVLGALGMLLVGLSGGKWKFNTKTAKFEFSGEFETASLLDKLTSFLNGKTDRKERAVMMQQKLQELQVSDTKGDIAENLGLSEDTKLLPASSNTSEQNVPQVPAKKKAVKKRKK